MRSSVLKCKTIDVSKKTENNCPGVVGVRIGVSAYRSVDPVDPVDPSAPPPHTPHTHPINPYQIIM